MPENPSTTVPAVVEKIIKPSPFSGEPEKAQISVGLKPGAEIQVTIEADSDDTTPKA